SAILDTTGAGTHTGTLTVSFASDLGGGAQAAITPVQSLGVSGAVYREASAQIATVGTIIHVGDSGTIAVAITNTAAHDGFSEDLVASLSQASGAFTIVSGGATGEIAAGATDVSSLSIGIATTLAGTFSGGVTVALTSDGGPAVGGID